jgi:hypothetical protein
MDILMYADFAKNVLLEGFTQAVRDQLGDRHTPLRRVGRFFRRMGHAYEAQGALMNQGMAQLVSGNNEEFGKKAAGFLNKTGHRRRMATEAMSGSRVTGVRKQRPVVGQLISARR